MSKETYRLSLLLDISCPQVDAITSSLELASRHCFITLEFISISVKLQLSHILFKKKKKNTLAPLTSGSFQKRSN